MEETERKLFSSLSTISNNFSQSRQVAHPFLLSFYIRETDHKHSSKNFCLLEHWEDKIGNKEVQGIASVSLEPPTL